MESNVFLTPHVRSTSH